MTGTSTCEELNDFKAQGGGTSSTQYIMEEICKRSNLREAYRRVKSNKGAAGIDGMTVVELYDWVKLHKDKLIENLLNGNYLPSPVRKVTIPKPNGGTRELGIPTVVDRLVQQATAQVLSKYFEPTFHRDSYGFRPGKNAHNALTRTMEYVKEDRFYVVDIDIEKFFDGVNHDMLLHRVSNVIKDKRVLKLIRRFLQSGIMDVKGIRARREGTPQGGPLSPILSNIFLTDLDNELTSRGLKFCRYADDLRIFVGSERSAERVMENTSRYLEKRLKLRVNREKSRVSHVTASTFLGYSLGSFLRISKESIKRVKEKLRYLTRRRCAESIDGVIEKINQLIRGWIQYFRLAKAGAMTRLLDSWIRRRLRLKVLHQKKRVYTRYKFFVIRGVPSWRAWITALSGKGLWRMSGAPSVHEAMPNKWFDELGLLRISTIYESIKC